MNRWSRVVVAAVLAAGVMLPGAGTSAVVEARQVPSSVQVCLDSSSGVVSRVALSSVCVGHSRTGRHQTLRHCCAGMPHHCRGLIDHDWYPLRHSGLYGAA
jgi:hypothetical protein